MIKINCSRPVVYNLFIIGIALTVSVYGCEGSESGMNMKALAGNWKSHTMDVTIHSINGSDSTKVLAVNQENYPEEVGLNGERLLLNHDGTYIEEYIGTNDSVVYRPSGYWQVVGDTIVIAQAFPVTNQAVYRYHIELNGDTATFTSVMDFDGDGIEDDDFKGVSIKTD